MSIIGNFQCQRKEKKRKLILQLKTKRQKKQKKPNNKENSKNIQFLNSLQQGKLKATNLPNLYYFNMSKSTGIAIKSETLFSIGMNQNVKKLK